MLIDLHCDTIYSLWEGKVEGDLASSSLSVDRKKLEGTGSAAQCFALFTPMYEHLGERDRNKSPWQVLNELHDRFVSETEKAGIPQMRKVSDLSDGGVHAVLTTEEGASIEGDISRLEILKEWGVKIFGLTWNHENELAYPNTEGSPFAFDGQLMEKGLKANGFEAVEECSRLGIIIDVSHLSDGGFADVASLVKGPFVATHSNARSITEVTRNLTDEQLKALADTGGMVGLNSFNEFVHPVESEQTVDNLVKHLIHMVEIMGIDHVGFGFDFSEFLEGATLSSFSSQATPYTIGLEDASHVPNLIAAIRKAGFSEEEIEKFAYKNWHDLIRRVLHE